MTRKLTRNKNFLKLWSSQILSQMAINIMNFLILVHIYERTNSSVAASLVWVAYGIPAIIFGPIAAAAVDVLDKRKILMYSNLIQGIIIFSYALIYRQYAFLSYGVVLLYSLLDQLYVPAEAASLPSVIHKKNLAQANSLFFISAQTSAILGFGFAGLISEAVGFTGTMILGAVMLIVAFVSTSTLPRLKTGELKHKETIEGQVFEFFARIKEGYLFIRHRKSVLFPFLLLMWLQVSLSMLVVILPAIGEQIIKTKPSLTGVFVIAPAGVGALIGTIVVPRLMNRYRLSAIIEAALAALGISFVFVSTIVNFFPFWLSRGLLVVSFFIIGYTYVHALVPALTFMQRQTPKKLLGRLFGNFWFLTNTATLIPVLFSATITDVLGARLMIFLLGMAVLSVLTVSRTYGKNAVAESVYVEGKYE